MKLLLGLLLLVLTAVAPAQPAIAGGQMALPVRPGWGADVHEAVLQQHPWPKA